MPAISDSERGLPTRDDLRRSASTGTRASSEQRSGPVGKANPGSLVGTESRDGIAYARYRAVPGTWVSASMAQLGYDKLYGRESAYGARTGLVLGADYRPLGNPDRIEPGQEYLIPIGATSATEPDRRPRAAPASDPARRPWSPPTRRSDVPHDAISRPRPAQRMTAQNEKALDEPLTSRRIVTEASSPETRLFTSGNATPKCYTPYPISGEEYADVLGIVAHAFIQDDYVRTLGLRRDRNVHIDDSFSGKRFRNFLINKNLRKLTPPQKAAIKAYRGKRPDIVLDTGTDHGFEEIKPAHAGSIEKGVQQVQEVARFMRAYNLPYPFGTLYVPKTEIPVGTFFVLGEPVDVYLSCARQRGLIVYHYCFRADWTRLKKKVRLVFMAFIAFIWIVLMLLDRGGTAPTPGPIEIPPTLPAPSPIPQPIIRPPDAVPAAPRLSGLVPPTTIEALRTSSMQMKLLGQTGADVAFEPYVAP